MSLRPAMPHEAADREACEHSCHSDPSNPGDHGGARSVYDLHPGQTGEVTQVNAEGAARQRLLAMGILPQALVAVERVAPAGGPRRQPQLGQDNPVQRRDRRASTWATTPA